MSSRIRWCGIDHAFTLMNPLTLHQSAVIREVFEKLGKGNLADERIQRWYRLRDSMGNPGDPPHQKVRLLKEYHRDKIYSEVFDNDPEAIRLYEEMEARGWSTGDGIEAALRHLVDRGVMIEVVSEVSSVTGTLSIVRFLNAKGLTQYFSGIITPAGRFGVDGQLLDQRFRGADKRTGTLYEKLREYLSDIGVDVGRAVIIGDDPKLDIEHAKKIGFITIQYTGIVNRGATDKADYVIDHWTKLSAII